MSRLKFKLKTFFNNPKLRAEGVQMDYTEKQLIEWARCKEDFPYFCEHFIKIVSLDKGLISFIPRAYQKKFIKAVQENRFTIAKLPRQYGKTIILMAYFIWLLLTQEDITIGILANTGATARKILAKLQKSYEHLPYWMQVGVKEWNKGNIELENGSRVLALPTTEAAGRSDSYNYILLDEFAFVPRNQAEEFYRSVYPTLTSGTSTKVIMVSTPNGMNLFYKFWTEAINRTNAYVPFQVHWSELDGRDEAWKQAQIKALGSEDAFSSEFECEFLGSANTLISGKRLKELAFVNPIFSNQGIDIYEHEKPGHVYVGLVDTSHGQGEDYSAMSIIDITQMPFKQVAKYRDSTINPIIYPTIVKSLGDKYNQAHLLVEINDVGGQVANDLYLQLEYENMLLVANTGKNVGQKISAFGSKTTQRGVKMSYKVKAMGCAALKTLLENGHLIINDFDTISELTTFIAQKKSFEADSGANDDLAMTLVLFGWLSQQEYFKDLTNTNLRKKLQEDHIKSLGDSVPPFFLSSSQEEQFEKEPDGTLWRVVAPQRHSPYK